MLLDKASLVMVPSIWPLFPPRERLRSMCCRSSTAPRSKFWFCATVFVQYHDTAKFLLWRMLAVALNRLLNGAVFRMCCHIGCTAVPLRCLNLGPPVSVAGR